MNPPSEGPIQKQIVDLRRLYNHMRDGGKWDYAIDTHRLHRAICTLEELSEGGCRNHCQTRQSIWREGYERAMIDHSIKPVARCVIQLRSGLAWKENKDGV